MQNFMLLTKSAQFLHITAWLLDEIQKPLLKPRQTSVYKTYHIVRNPKTYQLYTYPERKQYQLVYDKRVVDPRTFKTYPYGYLWKTPSSKRNIHDSFFLTCCCQKIWNENKVLLIFLCCFKDHPRCKNWTLDFAPAFLRGFSWAHDPFFPTGPRFPMPKHVTSGSLSRRSLFYHWSAVSHPKNTWLPVPWARDPFFTTGPRFPIPKHVTSAFPVTSGSGHVTSVTRGNPTTNQKPVFSPYEPTLLLWWKSGDRDRHWPLCHQIHAFPSVFTAV